MQINFRRVGPNWFIFISSTWTLVIHDFCCCFSWFFFILKEALRSRLVAQCRHPAGPTGWVQITNTSKLTPVDTVQWLQCLTAHLDAPLLLLASIIPVIHTQKDAKNFKKKFNKSNCCCASITLFCKIGLISLQYWQSAMKFAGVFFEWCKAD